MGFIRIYHGIPSGNLIRLAIENGPVEIVDLPIDSMVIFRSYVAVYQRVINLVGGIPTPLKNMKVNWDDYSQYMEK